MGPQAELLGQGMTVVFSPHFLTLATSTGSGTNHKVRTIKLLDYAQNKGQKPKPTNKL